LVKNDDSGFIQIGAELQIWFSDSGVMLSTSQRFLREILVWTGQRVLGNFDVSTFFKLKIKNVDSK
jgi:hypothetical protein